MSPTLPPSDQSPSGGRAKGGIQPIAASKPAHGKAEQSTPTKPLRKRRLWLRFVFAFVLLLLLAIVFLPNILALRPFRQRLLNRFFSHYNAEATMGELSLSWFTPVRVRNFKLNVEESSQAALEIEAIDGDVSLLHLLFGHDLGTFHISKPELNVEFNKDGTNLTRLIRAMQGASFITRPGKLEIVDASLQLRGQDSPQPWKVGGIDLQVDMIPAADNPAGVLVLEGKNAKLLSEAELTQEMCNDILKFVAPQLYHPTRTSGKVSLALDHFYWALGKSNMTELAGQLTLHSVEIGPGDVLKALSGILELQRIPGSVQIAKDDVVNFKMQDGRVDHDHLAFSFAGIQLVSHGTVGLDETLDFYIDLQLALLEGADVSERSILSILKQQHPTVHFTGTLNKPEKQIEGVSLPIVRTLIEFINRWLQRRQSAPKVPAASDRR